MSTEAETRGLRLALGAAASFALAILAGWPFATFSSVFTVLFLQAPAAMPPRALFGLLRQALLFLAVAWGLSTLLEPYPAVYLLAMALAVAVAFWWSTTGAGMLSVVLALLATLMMPYLVRVSADLSLMLVLWLPVNLAVAWAWTALLFRLIPPGAPPTGGGKPAPAPTDPVRMVQRMSLVTVPFAIGFYLGGSSALVTLIFVAILSQQLAAATGAGPTVARGLLKANLIGGAVAVAAYEVTAIAPLMLTAMLSFAVAALALAGWLVSARKDAGLAGTALTTVIILFGGALSPLSQDDVAMFDRIGQIGLALGWVLLAFVVVDAFLPLKPAAKPAVA